MTYQHCGAETRDGTACELPAGWGTRKDGGRCKLHGGASPRGSDSPHFEDGLFSDYLDPEDKATVDALSGYGDAEKLDELIDWRLARLRRYVRASNQDDTEGFFERFDMLVREGARNGEPGLSAKQIKELGKTLNQNNQAAQREIDLVRKLIKTRNKIAEGDDVNLSLGDLVE
jgi:hypothetical protein